MKTIFLAALLFGFCVVSTNAQSNASRRQLQKQEMFITAGGLVYIDNESLISSVTEMPVNDFLTYRETRLKINSFVELDKPTFDFTEEISAKWENDKMIIEKDRAFSKTSYVGIRQNIKVGYISSDVRQVTVNVQFNGKPPQQIALKKGMMNIIPTGLLDPANKKTRGYLSIQVYDFGLRKTPCSLDEIVNDIINKAKPPICT